MLYSLGIVNTYGAITISEAHKIIKRDINIEYNKYESIIKFVLNLEMALIRYDVCNCAICNVELRDEEDICDLLKIKCHELYMIKKYIIKSLQNSI